MFILLRSAATKNDLGCHAAARTLSDGAMRTALTALLFLALRLGAEPVLVSRAAPKAAPVELKSAGRLLRTALPECSGLWASPSMPGVFWAVTDHGPRPRLIPVRADGSFPVHGGTPWMGSEVVGAARTDWEAVTGEAGGRMVVADVGNNLSLRKELQLYVLQEPAPGAPGVSARRVAFSWPDQDVFPDPELSHDCEAAFMRGGKVYLLTKHRRDTLTDLWRIEIPAEGAKAAPVKVARFDALGMVTDASVSPDGTKLAVLTYRFAWVFDLPPEGEAFFSGRARGAALSPPLLSWQLEGCAWADASTLLLASEQGDLFRLPVSSLTEVK